MDQDRGVFSQRRLLISTFMVAVWMTSIHTGARGQVFLQLERANVLRVKKFAPGDEIHFMSNRFPGSWQKGVMLEILPEDEAIVFEDRITYLSDITHFKYYRVWPHAIGTNLMRFGVAWFVFAGIIEGGRTSGVLDTQYKFGTDTVIIGASALLTGFLTRKLWAVSTKKMNERHNTHYNESN